MIDWDYDQPLAQCKGETIRQNQALQDYVDLGAGRSLLELWKRYEAAGKDDPAPPTRVHQTLKNWSSQKCWQARLVRWAEIENERREAVRRERRQILEDRDWQDGDELRRAVAELLKEMPKFKQRRVQTIQEGGQTVKVVTLALNTTVAQLAQANKIASELQRLSTNEPTANATLELSGAAIITSLAKAMDDLVAAAEDSDIEWPDDLATAVAPEGH